MLTTAQKLRYESLQRRQKIVADQLVAILRDLETELDAGRRVLLDERSKSLQTELDGIEAEIEGFGVVDATLLQTPRLESAKPQPRPPDQAVVTAHTEERKLRVFLCHGREDKEQVRALRQKLLADGFLPWLDEEDILPGKRWRQEIPRQVRATDVVLVCLSKTSLQREGYLQREIKDVLDVAQEKPEDHIFIIPVRLEACDIPERLTDLQWVDLFIEQGSDRLIRALLARCTELGITMRNESPPRAVVNEPDRPGTTIARFEVPEYPPAMHASVPVPDTRINPIDGAEMVLIPAGEFLMGDDNSSYGDEKPAHRVPLDAYYLYKYPVTVAQYQAFCIATRRKMPPAPDFNPGWKHRRHPIVNVSWHDAVTYCEWAGVQLPTEAQWEKAARGTDGRKYPWGDEWDPEKCRCSRKEYGDSGGTIEVGSYEDGRSPYGAYDMAGNVWEWCRDLWDEQFYSKPEATERNPVNDRVRVAAEDRPGDETSMSQQFGKIETAESEDPENLKQSTLRVVRGGSWNYNLPDNFRCAYRDRDGPDDWYFNFGFRPSQGL